MTAICLMAMTGNGVPAFILALAMACDTAIIITAMVMGFIPHPA